MNGEKKYITLDKKEALEKELKELKGPERKKILDTLAYAKSLGDLSENAEYHQAREDQVKLEERIAKIEDVLKNSEIAEHTTGDIIGIGSKVVVQKLGSSETKNYVIVGAEEADMANGKISNQSPIGSAFFGKKKGDSVSFQTPGGLVDYKIIDVS